MRSRYVVAASVAACAACCAAPVLALPALAGLGASVAAFVCSGALLAILVAAAAAVLVWLHRRRPSSCAPDRESGHGPVDIELSTSRPGALE